MQKLNIIIISLFLFISSLFAEFDIQILRFNKYYNLQVYDTKEIPATNFNLMNVIDKSQTQRIILSSIEKSRLLSLLYVGDQYEFNNTRLSKIDTNVFYICDVENKYGIKFALGKYDDVILYSYINFYSKKYDAYKEVDEKDIIASGIAVKALLKNIIGVVTPKNDLPLTISNEDIDALHFTASKDDEQIILNSYIKKDADGYYLRQDLSAVEEAGLRRALDNCKYKFSKTLSYKEKVEAYDRFIAQLMTYGTPEQIVDKLIEFVTINIRVIDDHRIDNEWTNPYELYHTKVGDYKSIAFFYYHTFNMLNSKSDKGLNIDCEAYFVTPLKRKTHVTSKNYSREEQNSILMLNGINPETNLDINKYEFPEFNKSVFLVTVNYNGDWIYSTGKKWVYTDIAKRERVCADYSKNGCYYSVLKDSQLIIENIPINSSKIRWDVFFDISFIAD